MSYRKIPYDIKKTMKRRSHTPTPSTNLWHKLYKSILSNNVQNVRYLVEAGVLNQKKQRMHQTGRYSGSDDLSIKCINTALANIGNMEFTEEEYNDAWNIIKILRDGGLVFDPSKIHSVHIVKSWDVMEKVRFLVNNGMDINTTYGVDEITILMDVVASAVYDYQYNAATWNHDTYYPEIISELFDLGIDINIQSMDGVDAFMIAAGHSGCTNIYDSDAFEKKCTAVPSIPVLNILLDNLIRVNKKYNYKNEGETINGDNKSMLKTLEDINESYDNDYDKDELEKFILKFKQYNPTKPTKSVAHILRPSVNGRGKSRKKKDKNKNKKIKGRSYRKK